MIITVFVKQQTLVKERAVFVQQMYIKSQSHDIDLEKYKLPFSLFSSLTSITVELDVCKDLLTHFYSTESTKEFVLLEIIDKHFDLNTGIYSITCIPVKCGSYICN